MLAMCCHSAQAKDIREALRALADPGEEVEHILMCEIGVAVCSPELSDASDTDLIRPIVNGIRRRGREQRKKQQGRWTLPADYVVSAKPRDGENAGPQQVTLEDQILLREYARED
jgi:hypothetical protein